jgi:tetratricopeptide (TPR) repeat protein
MNRKLAFWLLISIPICFVVAFGASPARATSDCDKALHLFWKGRLATTDSEEFHYYEKVIQLCPGFIRPYELVGNLYRKKGQADKAIDYFLKASELGSNNHKLYYLLASLLFEKGDLDEASRHLKKSLSIRDDYPQSLELQQKIQKALDQDGPKLKLYEPSAPPGMILVHLYENITIRGEATDKSGVAWVKIDGVEAALDTEGNFLRDVHLQMGKNQISIEATDHLGNRSTVSVTVKRDESSPVKATEPGGPIRLDRIYDKSFAVVIGINQYEKWPVLEFALNDARAIEKKFKEKGFDEIITIVNQEATQRRILTELFHTLPQKVGRNDLVVFYFAGHGQTQDLADGGKKGFIIPVDADPTDCTSTAISMEQIRGLSNRIPAKHILYVMDCCYSGLGLSRSYGTSPKLTGYLRKVASMRAVQIVTAGGKGEQVQEREGHGLFTTYFLHALEGEADFDNDGVVTGTELGAYLRPKVSEASQQRQTPLYGRLEGEGEVMFFGAKR